jgi:hypothetical protein
MRLEKTIPMSTSHILNSRVDFLLQKSPRIQWDLFGTDFCQKIEKSMSLVCPFEENIPPNHSRESEFSKKKNNSV